MLRSLVEVHVDEVGIVGENDAVAGYGDFGGSRVADIGEEDAAPARGVGAGADILNVEHQVFEVFIKDAGLNFKGGLGAAQLAFQARERGRGSRGKPDVVAESEQPGGDGKDGDDADERPCAQAAGAHGGDFAVGGQAAEPDEDSDEQAHGDGDGAGHGQGEQEELSNAGQRSTVADDDFQQASEVAHEDDEGEQGDADGGVLARPRKEYSGKKSSQRDLRRQLDRICESEASSFESLAWPPGPGTAILVGFCSTIQHHESGLILLMAQGKLRVLLLWHMHQPFYKDLVSGEYRLPWVRLHALKDYYGMVKLLEEFPQVHQNFNMVPSLVAQIEDYNSGVFKDPFWDVAAKPAGELSLDEKHFALTYFFQAHGERMIGRYPRYRQLWEQVRAAGSVPANAAITFGERDYRDLQVLSQIAWFDEYYLTDPAVRELIAKGQGYTEEDQRFIMSKQHEILRGVLPAYRAASERGSVELSSTPYYHPILPLLCDTNTGRESVPGLPLPSERFRRPDDAEEHIRRALDAHERSFGTRPVGMWPSEGSVSDEVLRIAAGLGVQWMATDEGVLGRSLNHEMSRDPEGFLDHGSAEKLYNIYRWERDGQSMNMVFRDHRISDLLGFVYAGMPAEDAANT